MTKTGVQLSRSVPRREDDGSESAITARLTPTAPARLTSAYGGAAAAAAIACQTWFQPNKFIATGDVPPFFSPVNGPLTAVWGHSEGGAGGPSIQVFSVIPGALIRLVQLLGGSEILAQRIFYTLLFGAVASSVAFLAGAFTKRPGAVFIAGLIGAFNPFVMTNVPNPVILTVLALAGVLGGLVVRAASGDRPSVLVFALATLPCSYVVANPPSLAVCVGWVVALAMLGTALVGTGGTGRALRFLLPAAPWIVLLNLWWLAPAAISLVGAGDGVGAVTEVRDWAWTHSRSSVANVLRLNAVWAWAHPEYFPYSESLEKGPVLALGFVLPATCVMAPFLVKGQARRSALALGAVALVLVVLSTGLHPPFGTMNLWLFDHVPGYWLLREPASKLGFLLVLAYGGLVAIAVSAFYGRGGGRSSRIGGASLAAILLGAIAITSYPLWTGAVIPDRRPLLPSAHVAVPEEWRAAMSAVNDSSRPGKALVLPLGDYYQMPTTWGYYGADIVATSLLRRPALTLRPGSYFAPPTGFEALMTATEKALLLGDVESVPRLLQSLGVSHVLLRRDFDRGFPGRRIADPARLERTLAQVASIRLARPSPVVEVYELTGGRSGILRTYADVLDAAGPSPAPYVASATPQEAVRLRDSVAREVQAWALPGSLGRTRFHVIEPGRHRADVRPNFPARYVVRSVPLALGAELSIAPLDPVSIDNARVPAPGETRVRIPAGATAVQVDDRLFALSELEQVVSSAPDGLVFLGPSGPPAHLNPIGTVRDCNAYDRRPPSSTGLSARALAGPAGGVELRARDHAACVTIDAGPFVAGDSLHLRFQYQGVAGRPPRFCLWESGPDRCVPLPALVASESWTSYDRMVRASPGTTRLSLFFYADGDGTAETVTQYRAVAVEPMHPIAAPVMLPVGGSARLSLATGEHRVTFPEVEARAKLGPFSPLGDCNAFDARDPAEAGLTVERLVRGVEPSFRLQARSHSACISAPVENFAADAGYRLSFDYRTLQGQRARVCVWQEGPGGCAALPPLENNSSWRRVDATISPTEGTTGLRLFVYADGGGTGPTVTEYRSLELERVSSSSLVVARHTGGRVPPAVTVKRQSPERYRLGLRGGDGPFVLVLADTFDAGWRLFGLPSGVRAEHVKVDGYANGWLIDDAVTGDLVVEYVPGRLAHWARQASLTSGILALILILRTRLGRRWPSLLKSTGGSSGRLDASPGVDESNRFLRIRTRRARLRRRLQTTQVRRTT